MSLADELLATINDDAAIHDHIVSDSDSYFIIDPDSREIANAAAVKNTVMQFDHMSEIYTFEVPRYVEGHDMTLCNRARVHFINIDGANGVEHRDVAEMDDLHVDPEDENRVLSTWTIRREATQLAGNLSFAVQYMCVADDGEVVYEWHTDIYSDVDVKRSLNNSEAAVIEYTNILEEWYQKLFSSESSGVSDEQIAKAVSDYLTENPIEQVTEEELTAAIEAYFIDHPIENDTVTEEELAEAIGVYLAEHPIEGGGTVGFIAQPEPPSDTSVLWIDTDDDEMNNSPDSSQNATLTANGKALLRALLTAAVYDSEILPDPSTTIEAFLAELDVVVPDSGGGTDEPDVPDVPDEPEKTTFTVTYNLNGVVSSNTATSATEGNGFTTVLSAGSAIDSVTVKMGGVDITETAYNSTSGMITIAKVTGDIVITAAIADPSLLYQLKDASFNGATIVDTGVSLFDEKKDFTILFDFENASCANKALILGLVEDDTITDSYQHFYVCTNIANKNQDTETIKCYSLISRSELIDFPSQPSDADNREYSAKLAVTFDSTRDKWTAKVLNIKTGETAENTLTKSVTTMPNTVAIGGSSYRGKTSFTCNEFSIYNRVLSADEISAWMQ